MAANPAKPEEKHEVAALHNGDRMTRAEFHRVYEIMPEQYRAELIAGVVYEPSPWGWAHAEHHGRLNSILDAYAGCTTGISLGDNPTIILGEEDEVQPDLVLRIQRKCGGKSRQTKKGYISGAPELVAEIAHSSRAIDMHLKKERYIEAGVLEYMVVCLSPKRFHWFDLSKNIEFSADAEGIFRSTIFPGLWIDSKGLLELDYQQTMYVLNSGMETPEYKQFCSSLVT